MAEDKTLLCPLPVPNKTRKFGMGGWGAFIPSPKAVGLECVLPPPHFFHSVLLSLQIPCSLVVAKLICNSCAHYPPPTRLREIKMKALGCCHAGPMLFGWDERKSTKYRGTYQYKAQFFLGVVLFFFSVFFFKI